MEAVQWCEANGWPSVTAWELEAALGVEATRGQQMRWASELRRAGYVPTRVRDGDTQVRVWVRRGEAQPEPKLRIEQIIPALPGASFDGREIVAWALVAGEAVGMVVSSDGTRLEPLSSVGGL